MRPVFLGEDEEPQVKLVGSRHPVLDAVAAAPVVPNDISLSSGGCRVQVITGCAPFIPRDSSDAAFPGSAGMSGWRWRPVKANDYGIHGCWG